MEEFGAQPFGVVEPVHLHSRGHEVRVAGTYIQLLKATPMLIIARRKGDRIKIGDDIELVVTDVSRAGVRLGIVAPTNVAIVRGEVKAAAEEANRDAARSHLAVLGAEKPAQGDAVVVNPSEFLRDSRSS